MRSFCAIKPHLFVLLPLTVILQRRWRVFCGAAGRGALLLAISFAAGGRDWPRSFFAQLVGPGQTKDLDHMPNLHTLSALLGPADLAVEIVLGAGVVLATAYLALRAADYELAFTFGMIGSRLMSAHSYTPDCLALLLPLAIVLSRPVPKSVRSLTELAASPIANFLTLAGAPFNIAMPCILSGILAVAVRKVNDAGAPARPARVDAPVLGV